MSLKSRYFFRNKRPTTTPSGIAAAETADMFLLDRLRRVSRVFFARFLLTLYDRDRDLDRVFFLILY